MPDCSQSRVICGGHHQMTHILHIMGDSEYGDGGVLIERLAMEAMRHGYPVSVLATDSTVQESLRKGGVGVVDLDCIWLPTRPIWNIAGLI